MDSVRPRFVALAAATMLIAVPQFINPPKLSAGLPWFSKRSEQSSAQWWAERGSDPVGARQNYVFGKTWPPQPRPTGKPQLFVHKYYSSHYWPLPYQNQDRQYIRELSNRQINNGWVTATTLYDYHFDEDTHEVNRAGRSHLQWILENVPERHRFVFVQTSQYVEQSQSRLAGVKTELTNMVGSENLPPIMLRLGSPLGRPANEVDVIRRAELESIPKPRITDPIGGAGAAPSSGGGL